MIPDDVDLPAQRDGLFKEVMHARAHRTQTMLGGTKAQMKEAADLLTNAEKKLAKFDEENPSARP